MSLSSFYYTILLSIMLTNWACQESQQSKKVETPSQISAASMMPMSNDDKSLSNKVKGLSFVAPPRPFSKTPMMDVKAVNATWIAVIPYAFTKQGEPKVRYSSTGGHWWGEKPIGVQTTIDSAHRAGLHVMMKPQVYVGGGWTGNIDYATDADWQKWENDYENYLMPFVKIADSMHVEMICIGTEFKIGVVKREKFWRNLILKIRKQYNGKLTYAANWDEYPLVPFWDALDYIGVNAYFPLIKKQTPSVFELVEAWKPHFEALKKFHKKYNKPILFTEFGYLSVDGCAFNSWEIEKCIQTTNLNEQAQANAIDGIFSAFWKESWWAGGFLWKWFPEGQGHEGYMAKDYTPQGKKAEVVLTKWYGQ